MRPAATEGRAYHYRHALRTEMKNTIFDIVAALIVAGALLVGLLAYFDILTK